MNALFEVAESSMLQNRKYSFATTTHTDEDWVVDYHLKTGYTAQIGYDWWLTIGKANNALTAEITSYEDVNGVKHFCANVKYYLFDYYDWDIKGEKALAELHYMGRAKFYRVIGECDITIEWVAESRFPMPKTSADSCFNITDTSFDGIDDNGFLSDMFTRGIDWYNRVNRNYSPTGGNLQ